MDFNSFLYPASPSSYSIHNSLGEIVYIPRAWPKKEDNSPSQEIKAQEDEDLNVSGLEAKNHAKVMGMEGIIDGMEDLKNVNSPLASKVSTKPKEDNFSSLSEEYADLKHPVPCLFLPNKNVAATSKIVMYFHGNAEDVGLAAEMLDYIRYMMHVRTPFSNFQVHILAVEYPGYGIYDGTPNAEQILVDACNVFDFLVEGQGIKPEQIIVFGRSIGSGPATHLAATRQPGCMLLISPFTCIKDIVVEVAGKVASKLVRDRFRNIDKMAEVKCPTFLIHGMRDTLISYQQSQQLHDACGGPAAAIYPMEMDHNEFDYVEDLVQPFAKFLKQCGIVCDTSKGDKEIKDFTESLFVPPADFPKENKNYSLWNAILRKFM